MSINNINRMYGYSNDIKDSNIINDNLKGRSNIYKDMKEEKAVSSKDKIEISKESKKVGSSRLMGSGLIDKGTAAHTTIYVDKATINQILSYTTNNPECQWEEMGSDEDKEWVVVNGQRFERPRTKEEKEAIRKLRRTLADILLEEEKKQDEIRKNTDKPQRGKLNFNNKNKFEFTGDKDFLSNEKIKNLQNNEKVMNMLSNVSSMMGGQGIQFSLRGL